MTELESKHVALNNYIFYVLIKLLCLTDTKLFYCGLRNTSGWQILN